jgi:hypothetical protein
MEAMEAATQPKTSVSRTRFVFCSVLIVLAVVAIFAVMGGSPAQSSRQPRFVPMQMAPTNATTWEMYNWNEVDPCPDGKVWIWATLRSQTNLHRHFLYDLKEKLIVGEMLNGGAITFNQDGSKLLCGSETDPKKFLDRMLFQFLNIVAKLRHTPTPKPPYRYEAVWALNLRSNTAAQVGILKQFNGSGSTWRPSPSRRFAFNQTSAQSATKTFFVFDFETDSLKEMPCAKHPMGWWDDQAVLISDNDDVALCNVLTGETTKIVTRADIDSFMQTNSLPSLKKPNIIYHWNGAQYEFYLAPDNRYDTNAAPLVEIERSGPSLKMISPSFEFHWLGQWSSDRSLYLYSGESGRWGRGGDGSVMLRDLRDNSVRALVPADKSGQYSLCRFYDGGVIYSRKRHLWRVDLNGSNNMPLFSGNGN